MANVYSIKGEVKGKVSLPEVFNTTYRPDLIQRSFVSEDSKTRQKHSIDHLAGFRTSADYFGSRRHPYRQTINKGQTRLPRIKPGGGGLGEVRIVPQSKGGHRAHPPKGKDYSKSINKKEYELALRSAIAATKEKNLVADRGHRVEGLTELPIVVEDAVQKISKSGELKKALNALGLKDDLRVANVKRKAGRSEARGRARKTRKTVLLVVGEDEGVMNAASNLPGVDAVKANDLKVSQLAPGTKAGRLTVWTESAIKNIGAKWNPTK